MQKVVIDVLFHGISLLERVCICNTKHPLPHTHAIFTPPRCQEMRSTAQHDCCPFPFSCLLFFGAAAVRRERQTFGAQISVNEKEYWQLLKECGRKTKNPGLISILSVTKSFVKSDKRAQLLWKLEEMLCIVFLSANWWR